MGVQPVRLTDQEVDQFAARSGVRREAVENFLSSIDAEGLDDVDNARSNLETDAALYGWDKSTVRAIALGVELLERKLNEVLTKASKETTRHVFKTPPIIAPGDQRISGHLWTALRNYGFTEGPQRLRQLLWVKHLHSGAARHAYQRDTYVLVMRVKRWPVLYVAGLLWGRSPEQLRPNVTLIKNAEAAFAHVWETVAALKRRGYHAEPAVPVDMDKRIELSVRLKHFPLRRVIKQSMDEKILHAAIRGIMVELEAQGMMIPTRLSSVLPDKGKRVTKPKPTRQPTRGLRPTKNVTPPRRTGV